VSPSVQNPRNESPDSNCLDGTTNFSTSIDGVPLLLHDVFCSRNLVVEQKRIGQSLLLALTCWIVLTLLWNLCQDGGPAFKFIAAIFRPGLYIGTYLRRTLPANEAHRSFLDLAGILLVFTAFWYAVIRVAKGMRSEVRIDEPPDRKWISETGSIPRQPSSGESDSMPRVVAISCQAPNFVEIVPTP
jgi:hypothetical protein